MSNGLNETKLFVYKVVGFYRSSLSLGCMFDIVVNKCINLYSICLNIDCLHLELLLALLDWLLVGSADSRAAPVSYC